MSLPEEEATPLPDSHVSRSSVLKRRFPGLLHPLPPPPVEAPKPPRPPNHPPPYDPWPKLPDVDIVCLSLRYKGTLFDADSVTSMKSAAAAYDHLHKNATEFYDTSTGLLYLYGDFN